MTTFDDKWSLGSSKKEFGFLNFKQLPFWTSKAYHKDETVSINGGLTEIETEDNIIMGIYFFNDDYRVEHSRQVYTLVNILTEAGGIATSLIAAIGLFASIYNYYVYVMHFIHLLYFVRDEKETEKSGFLTKSGRNLFSSAMSMS